MPAPSTPQLFDDDDYPFSSATAEQQRLEQQRLELNSREFSALFLDGSPGLDIPYEELRFGRRLGCGGFKDCYAGKKRGREREKGHVPLCVCVRVCVYNHAENNICRHVQGRACSYWRVTIDSIQRGGSARNQA